MHSPRAFELPPKKTFHPGLDCNKEAASRSAHPGDLCDLVRECTIGLNLERCISIISSFLSFFLSPGFLAPHFYFSLFLLLACLLSRSLSLADSEGCQPRGCLALDQTPDTYRSNLPVHIHAPFGWCRCSSSHQPYHLTTSRKLPLRLLSVLSKIIRPLDTERF